MAEMPNIACRKVRAPRHGNAGDHRIPCVEWPAFGSATSGENRRLVRRGCIESQYATLNVIADHASELVFKFALLAASR